MTVSYNTLGTSVPNWQLVQTASPSSVATVTFSGLSGYSKYRLVAFNLTVASNNPGFSIRLNGDAGANYFYMGITMAGSSLGGGASVISNQIQITTNPGGSLAGIVLAEIDHALMLGPKIVTSTGMQQGFGYINQLGMYQTSALATSLTFFALSGNTYSGTLTLLGAN
jgi:hypothetical protein